MALIIGIENGIEKGFTEEEIQVTNGFAFGVLCMRTGTGKIGEGRYSVSAEETYERFVLMLDALDWQHDEVSEFITLENVKRLEEAGWTANIGHKSREEFMWHLKNTVFDKLFDKHNPSYLHRTESYRTWNDVCKQEEMIRTIVGEAVHSGSDQYYIGELCEVFDVWNMDLSEPFYYNKYLIYDEDADIITFSNKPQEE
jgi:hypothetical protein